jgi:hypothetical protein
MRILSLLIFSIAAVFSNNQTDSPHGPGFKISCKTCHSPKGWQLDKSIYSFNHNATSFPLAGQHSEINCRQCHASLKFAEAKTNCNECHKDIHQSTVGPDCSRCHTPVSWLVHNINEIHQLSRFPLLGAHRTAGCSQCHKTESLLRFDVNGVNCIDCHRDKYLATTNPNHVQSGISEDCTLCHPMTSFQWTGAGFDHNAFPLSQGHSTVKCTDCHLNGSFTTASPVCNSCHQQDFLSAKNPDHAASQFPSTCQDCHTLSPGWKPVTFDHNTFPLRLGHSVPACIDCHTGGNYTSTPPACYSCHQQNYAATANPNHTALGYAKTCETCHTLSLGWKPASLNHSVFPLTLGHSAAACADCHKGGNYTTLPTDCYSCHQQNFTATTNPNHIAAGFPTTCQTCHTATPGWNPVTFNHNNFPLNLGHSVPACADCHKGGNYTTTSTNCYSCHQQDYTASTNPNHIAAGFSTTCQTCHTLNPGWKPAVFNHANFPLTQGHSTPVCADCHKGGNYSNTSADCYSCHQLNYTSTTNPNHSAAGFPTTCATCHSLAPGWKPASFDHTVFPLTLGHSTPACADCHKGGNYTTIPADCYSCHQQNYTASTNPNHIAAGFPTACATCHTTNPGWKPASFNHTGFPLTLGHATPSCADCHKGNYTTTSSDCYSCHATDYNNSVNPGHKTLAFSTTCTQCHTTNPGWKPATYASHDTQFPIYSGRHKGKWTLCSDCHTDPASYTLFNCIVCHSTAHRGKGYTNAQCFSCHPRGTSN